VYAVPLALHSSYECKFASIHDSILSRGGVRALPQDIFLCVTMAYQYSGAFLLHDACDSISKGTTGLLE